MSSRAASPASLFPTPENGGGETMTAISGRRCSALLTKSGPLGSLVRMLLESPLWWKEGYVLTWDAIPLYSRRVMTFTDTNSIEPSPSNESAETLSISDIPSNRCLFRLRLSAHPTEETESSSLPLMLTPTSVQMTDTPDEMQKRKQKNGNATHSQGLSDLAHHGLLPTPRANSAMGTALDTDFNHEEDRCRNLETVIGKMMLPTPTARDEKNPSPPDGERIAQKVEKGYTIELNDLAAMVNSRLRPLGIGRGRRTPAL